MRGERHHRRRDGRSYRDWADVDVAYTKYRHCDDGAIAEGNPEAIARLLADRGSTLPQLAALIQRHPPPETFVLDHLDTTLDTGDLERIATLATASCPGDLGALCHALATAASQAAH